MLESVIFDPGGGVRTRAGHAGKYGSQRKSGDGSFLPPCGSELELRSPHLTTASLCVELSCLLLFCGFCGF